MGKRIIVSILIGGIILVGIFNGCREALPAAPCSGAISSASPEATAVGLKVLESGGNAADAAIAIAFMLGVTEPAMSGIGGGCQIMLSKPGKVPVSINGTTLAPAATRTEIAKDSLDAYTKCAIPSMVKAMEHLFRQHGSGNLSWKELITPAVEVAEEGFTPGPFRALVYQEYGPYLQAGGAATRQWLNPDGSIPNVADTIKQPLLARTLGILAEKGANEFYRGDLARQIAADMENHRGWITYEDLANFPDPQERPALAAKYGEFTVYTAPPPAGGVVMLTALKLWDGLLQGESVETSDSLKLLVKALGAAQATRDIRSPDLLLGINRKWSKDEINDFIKSAFISNQQDEDSLSGETTHFSVVDGEGMALSITASINAYFGSRASSPELGFLYNSYMTDFIFQDPKHPDAIQPGKPAYSSMSPAIVRRGEQDVLILGSPGSRRIISSVAQIIHYWTAFHQDLAKALDHPRIHAIGSKVWLEQPDPILEDLLNRNGFQLRAPGNKLIQNGLNPYFGGIHAISLENERWIPVADPRRDGAAMDCENTPHLR